MPAYYEATTAIWDEWVDCYSTTSTASSTDTWGYWVDGTATVTMTSTETVWYEWNSSGEVRRIAPQPRELSEEERAAQEVRQAENRRIAAEQAEKRKQAKERSMKLLRDALDKKQRNRFDNHGHFFVRGVSGELYRIDQGRVANVKVMDGDKVKHRLCAHVREQVPDHDNMLAQKVMLENFEDEFLRMANVH